MNVDADKAKFGPPVAKSPAMQQVLELALRVAATEAAILITGERGTGKARMARTLHARSPRRDGPFVALHCEALPEAHLARALFDPMGDTFTRTAKGGTLFLAAIDALPLAMQGRLLRALKAQTHSRAAVSQSPQVAVRFLAATRQDLAARVEAKTFCQDLYHHLRGTIPGRVLK